MSITTLFIDADETIFDFKKGQYTAFNIMWEKLGFKKNEEAYNLYDRINDNYWHLLEQGKVTKSELIIKRFSDLSDKIGIRFDPYLAEDIYQYTLGNQAFWFEGAKDAIIDLSKRYDIYVTTNGDASTQKNRAHLAGLDKYIKDMFVSEEIGFPKPQKEYFDYCTGHSNNRLDEIVMIGDSLRSDIKGATEYGIKSIWANFRKQNIQCNYPIVIEAHNWQDILNYLE